MQIGKRKNEKENNLLKIKTLIKS